MKIIITESDGLRHALVVGEHFRYTYSRQGGFRYDVVGGFTDPHSLGTRFCYAPDYIALAVCDLIDDFIASEGSGKLNLTAEIMRMDKEYREKNEKK